MIVAVEPRPWNASCASSVTTPIGRFGPRLDTCVARSTVERAIGSEASVSHSLCPDARFSRSNCRVKSSAGEVGALQS